MPEKTYFLCSKQVVEIFKPSDASKPFKSGWTIDKDEDFFVAVLDYDAVRKYYDEVIEPQDDAIDFWAGECCEGTMDISKITIAGCKRYGLFVEIERVLNLTAVRNQAMVIKNLSMKYGVTPVEFINKIA